MRYVSKAMFTFYPQEWDSVSEEAKDFIRKLIVVDPKSRMAAAQCFEHPWLEKVSTATVNLSGVIKGITHTNKRCRNGMMMMMMMMMMMIPVGIDNQ